MAQKIILLSTLLIASLQSATEETLLEKNCISCHTEQKIPSELIYRRYLLKYSTNNTIEKKIMDYLKNPKRENSIMPKQFFLKFPEKVALDLNKTVLEESINAYMEFFDVKKELTLK